MKKQKNISWEIAFRQQAIAEYHTYQLLLCGNNREFNIATEIEAECLMLLQMVIEKLFKSAYAQITGNEPKHDHAQVIFLALNVINRIKAGNNVNPLRLSKGIVPLIHKLGEYHPHADYGCSIEDGQFEYPWQTPQGAICYPAKDITFSGFGFTDKLQVQLHNFIQFCLIDKFDVFVNQLRPFKNELAI